MSQLNDKNSLHAFSEKSSSMYPQNNQSTTRRKTKMLLIKRLDSAMKRFSDLITPLNSLIQMAEETTYDSWVADILRAIFEHVGNGHQSLYVSLDMCDEEVLLCLLQQANTVENTTPQSDDLLSGKILYIK